MNVRLALLALALACQRPANVARPRSAPAIPDRVPPVFPAGWRHPAGARATFAEHGMVASDAAGASAAGVEILRRGGNAVDAAVAVGFALAVAFPEAGNLGGGGYMVVRLASGETAALDYREVAPRRATRDMYLDADGRKTTRSLDGALASGVPATVAGLASAQSKYGTLPLGEVLRPAIRLAEEGVVVDADLAKSLRKEGARIAAQSPAAAATFLPGGPPPAVGTRLRQPELARTLRAIAERGADAFYRGEIADSIAAEMSRDDGIIDAADLAAYRPVWRRPIRSTYRGYALLTMPPSSSGGITITETLNVLETYDRLPPVGSAAYVHVLASALQRTFIDRNAKLADPDFAAVPLDQLTSKAYARSVRATIDDGRATPTTELTTSIREGTETTHYSVVDAAGNAVASTTTLNSLYGSGAFVRGAGFFLNDTMDDFAVAPGTPNQYGLVERQQNAVEPGKRPLSAMSPTIVLDPRGQLLLVVGSRGGPRIISSTMQVILDVIDHRMTIADAMSAPRVHHQALPDTLRVEIGGLAPAVADSLAAMGHRLGPPPDNAEHLGLVNAIMRVRGGYEALPEPRRPRAVAGY